MTGCHARLLTTIISLTVCSTPIYVQSKADLWEAVVIGDLDTLELALGAGVDLDVREPNGSTPLIVAAMFGQKKLVAF